jgi:hypothetical protein
MQLMVFATLIGPERDMSASFLQIMSAAKWNDLGLLCVRLHFIVSRYRARESLSVSHIKK